jgi:hypothetical protein
MSALTVAELALLRSLGVTGYKAAEVLASLHGLLAEWVACATNIDSGEAVAKVDKAFVERCRVALGQCADAGDRVVAGGRGAGSAGTEEVAASGHSDDWVHEVQFDASPWFAQASDDEIRALHDIGYCGDSAADEVLLFFEDQIAAVGALVEYCRRSQEHGREGVGFECVVEERAALRWLNAHRPGVCLDSVPNGHRRCSNADSMSATNARMAD